MKTANLTYNEAKEALSCNLLVKLPEWDGHWFKNDIGGISVLLSNGKVETPPFEGYEKRTDWYITDGSRDFGGAIRALKGGQKVIRKGWNCKNMYVQLVENQQYGIVNDLGNLVEEKTILAPWLGMKTADNKFVPWNASQTDQLATDWYIV